MEISDRLLRQARELAAREGVALRTLVERGLHHVVTQKEREAPFKLRRPSFKGQRQQPELSGLSWETLRDLIYRDKGE